jgi:hypothetical protein
MAQELPPIPAAVDEVTAGQPATAAQVNALIDAVNAQSQWIQALADNEADDVAGKTYYIEVVETDFEAIKYGNDPTANIAPAGSGEIEARTGFSVVNMQTSEGTLVFNTDGTVVLDIDENNVALATHPVSDIGPLPDNVFFDEFTQTATYSQNEGVVTLNFPPDQETGDPASSFEFYVSRDGQKIMKNDRWFLESQECFDETAGIDITGDQVADPGCSLKYETSQFSGIEYTPAIP